METIGWISAVLLMMCGVPEAWKARREGYSNLSDGLIWMWGIGDLLGLVYVASLGSWPLIMNYMVNAVSVGIIAKYKYFPREE